MNPHVRKLSSIIYGKTSGDFTLAKAKDIENLFNSLPLKKFIQGGYSAVLQRMWRARKLEDNLTKTYNAIYQLRTNNRFK